MTNLGGDLRIQHRGQKVEFSWAESSARNIQWAAFYGDCEHEVLEVIKGNRVTLTYNLYHSRIGDLGDGVHLPEQLPLYNTV